MTTPDEVKRRIMSLLKGIDQRESDHDGGWWETSTGAEFGAGVKARIEAELDALATQAAPAARPVAWQPIETALMSGRGERPRWFLAYNGHHIGVCARWADEGYGETIADELDEVVVPPPTHWMPLPPPPQADEQHTKSQLKRIAAQKGEKPE